MLTCVSRPRFDCWPNESVGVYLAALVRADCLRLLLRLEQLDCVA